MAKPSVRPGASARQTTAGGGVAAKPGVRRWTVFGFIGDGGAGLPALAILAALIALGGTWPERAFAQTVCVTCEGPDQSYSCSFAPLEAGESAGGRTMRALQYLCIQELAQTKGHAACKVNNVLAGVCAGEVYMLQGRSTAGPRSPAGQTAATPVEPAPGRDAGTPGNAEKPATRTGRDEPKTVVEMAKRAAGQTKKEIEKSGEDVENALRKTWRCVTSLFDDCAGERRRDDGAPKPVNEP